MKSIVRFSVLVFFTYFFTGCIKAVIIPVQQNPIVGSWVLSGAAEGDASGWHSFNTGIENGVFDFFNNGSAQYSDAHVSMQGRWSLTKVSGGYYDEYGSFYNGLHERLELHLSDNNTHSTIDLSFDNINFYPNNFAATYFNGRLIERYFFERY